MERKEAIARIIDHMEVHGIGRPPHVYIAQALELALDALREAEGKAAGCKYCSGKHALYQQTYHTKVYISKFGRRRTLEIVTDKCPPFARCSARGMPACSTFAINFCPECGRNLTPTIKED